MTPADRWHIVINIYQEKDIVVQNNLIGPKVRPELEGFDSVLKFPRCYKPLDSSRIMGDYIRPRLDIFPIRLSGLFS